MRHPQQSVLWLVPAVIAVTVVAVAESRPPVVHKLAPELLVGEGRRAAEAFGEGDPAEAARRYQVLLDTRGVSADLLYNLGTTSAHAQDVGRALWALESARMLTPRNEAVEHNLQVVRQRVRVERLKQKTRGKLTEGEPESLFLRRLATSVTELELAVPVVVLNALLFLVLVVRRFKSSSGGRDALTVLAGVLAFLMISVLTMMVSRAVIMDQIQMGVVLDVSVVLSDTPAPSARGRKHTDLYKGATLRVLEQRSDGWVQVKLVDGSDGWVGARHIGVVE